MGLAFSSEAEQRIDALVARYPERQAALIPVLWLAQREFGYLSTEVMQLIAGRLDLPEAKVIHTATFYSMFHKRPVGRYHLQLCKTLSCYLRHSDSLVERIADKLGIGPGETTPDKLFTLELVECLAACGTAPVVQVNEDYYESLTPDKLDKLLDELAAKAKSEAS